MKSATPEDIPDIVRMGIAFCEHLGQPHDEAVMEQTAKQLMENDDAVLLVDKGSMAAAISYQHFFSNDTIAQELFWWVDPEYRGNGKAIKMLRGLESWAKDQGANSLTMIAMGGGVEKIYERKGYVPFEKTYVKVF